ncbi:TPA: hypothetical protein ACH3X1_006608 [Trebouxia sp. C0004]
MQTTLLASLAQELPSSMLPTHPALTSAGQPSVALPLKAPAAPMNTQSGALTTNGQPSITLPSKAAAAGLGLSQVSSVDQPHMGIKSPGDAPSVVSHPTRPLSRMPSRVREAATVEPISTDKAKSTVGKAEPLAAKRRQPISPMARPSNSRPSVLAAAAGILNADRPADLCHGTSPSRGSSKTVAQTQQGLKSLRSSSPKYPHHSRRRPTCPPAWYGRYDRCRLERLPQAASLLRASALRFPAAAYFLRAPAAELASEAHSVQPHAVPAAASVPTLPSFAEAEVAATPSSKESGKPPGHPRIKALAGARGKGLPLLPPAVTPIKSPAAVPTGSSMGAVMGKPPYELVPTPLVADAAPFGTSTKAQAVPFGAPSKALTLNRNAAQTPSPIVSEPSPVKSPLKSLTKAFTLPKKAPGKTSTKGKGLAGSSPAKAASKLLSPIKFLFGSSTATAKVDAACDQLPMASSPALEASVPTAVPAHSVDSEAAVAAASSCAQSLTEAPTSLPRVPDRAGDPLADSAPHVDVSPPTNRMPSFLGTSRIPIRKPGLTSDGDSKAMPAKLASSRSIRTSSSALPRAQHRAGVTQPVTAAAEKDPSRNPFAKSILKRLASKGKENAGSSSHLEVAPASAHQQPLATSSKLGGVTGADSSLLTSRPVSEHSRDSGDQNVNAAGLKIQPVSVLSSIRSSPVQPQPFAGSSAVPVAAMDSNSHGNAAVAIRQDISGGNSGMGSTPSSSPKVGPALRPQHAASTMSCDGPSAAMYSMPRQGVDLSFSSSPKLSPLVLAPPKAASLTPLGVAASPQTVLAARTASRFV